MVFIFLRGTFDVKHFWILCTWICLTTPIGSVRRMQSVAQKNWSTALLLWGVSIPVLIGNWDVYPRIWNIRKHWPKKTAMREDPSPNSVIKWLYDLVRFIWITWISFNIAINFFWRPKHLQFSFRTWNWHLSAVFFFFLFLVCEEKEDSCTHARTYQRLT